MLGNNTLRLLLLLSAALIVVGLACGGDDEGDEGAEKEPEFRQAFPTGFEGSGEEVLKTAATMTMVGGVKQWDDEPKGISGGLLIAYKDEYRATVEMETVGGQPANGKKIVIDLYHSNFPFFQKGDVTFLTNNFIFLAREGFFDGLPFTVDAGRLVRTGDPPGPLDGAGYEFQNHRSLHLRHDRPGIVSIWNKGMIDGKGTNSSQWFITLKELPELDYYTEDLDLRDCAQPDVSCHSAFGWVFEGMDVVESIVEGDKIKTVTIERLERGTGSKIPR